MDLQLKKAFTEMQMNKVKSTKTIYMLDMKMDSMKESKQRLFLTNREVSSLTPDTVVYSSVGRMFVQGDVPTLTEEIKTKQSSLEESIVQCEKNKEILLKKLKEQEDSLRELVQQKKAKTTGDGGD